ncbi:MAG: FtsQ-type POTRA domain-containing protein [Sphingomonas sp.]|nr:FtsQ-type POTRA domain-containing protein [Sphingomonas sp.]
MTAAHVRRGASARSKPRKSPKVTVPKKIAKRLPVDQARANKLAGLVFAAFMLAIALVVVIALDSPGKAERAAAAAVGHAGFTVSGYQIVGLAHMSRAPIDTVVTEELRRAADEAGTDKAPQALVDTGAIRRRLLQFGWVKDARILRRLPDTLVIDIVERKPAALWQNQGQLALIDSEGIVLDRVPVDKMPDLPLLIGPGANAQEQELAGLLADVPTLKPQLASATWVGGRRWDLNFQSGETVALPEGDEAARSALVKFARLDKQTALLGRGIVRFDLRVPGKMIVRLPHPLEPAKPAQPVVG